MNDKKGAWNTRCRPSFCSNTFCSKIAEKASWRFRGRRGRSVFFGVFLELLVGDAKYKGERGKSDDDAKIPNH